MTPEHLLNARRNNAANAWNLTDEIVLVAAGEPVSKPGGADQTYPFLPHNEYLWLADRRIPGSVLAFDPKTGWVDFVPPVSQAERVWEGGRPEEGVSADGLPTWLQERAGRPVVYLGSPLGDDDAALRDRLREGLLAVRRPKDTEELDRMRRAIAATTAGFAKIRSLLTEGRTEREIQIELEAEFFRNGGDRTSFGTIVGSGPHAAVFHFEPAGRRLKNGELVLVDAGAEVEGYAADVTRTYPVGGAFTPEQRDLYEILLGVQKTCISLCQVGTEFRFIHEVAARGIAEGLVGFGLLRGSVDELVQSGASALFFPHGLGHLVGLGVRDASGYLPGRKRSTHPVFQYLRVDLPLGEGWITTIEPGIYFVPALLTDPALRAEHKNRVDWARVDGMLDFGGYRIEDDVLVTEQGPVVLTAAIPKELNEISG